MNNSLTAKIVGQFLYTIGILSVLAFIFLVIFFVGYFNDIPSIIFFGPLTDIFGSLEAILSAVLATVILFSKSKRWIWLHLIGAILAWMGAFIVTLDSLMAGGIISTNTGAILSIKYAFPLLLTTHDIHFGFGFIGVWLVIIVVQAAQSKAWPNRLTGLGFITGIIMIFGFAGNSPLGFVFLYPIWCIWLGQHILKSVIKKRQ
jgi:hypothetical protein